MTWGYDFGNCPNSDGWFSWWGSSLTGVQSLVSTKYAFCVLKEDSTLVCWGHPEFGGNAENIHRHIDEHVLVESIDSTNLQFTAHTMDGRTIQWGYYPVNQSRNSRLHVLGVTGQLNFFRDLLRLIHTETYPKSYS